MKIPFKTQFDRSVASDFDLIRSESPVVSGQAVSNSELFRRLSQGLPVGCATKNYNSVNPRADKLATLDSIRAYQIRHGIPVQDPAIEVPDPAVNESKNDSLAENTDS